MFGGSMFGNMEDDPFFGSMHRQHMQHMNRMMQDPFGMFAMRPMDPFGSMMGPNAITDGRQQGRQDRGVGGQSRDLTPAYRSNPYGDIFGHMNQMMMGMNSMMGNMHRQMEAAPRDPNSQFYSQSTVMSYSNAGGGAQPRMYQASTSTHQAGGVKETKRMVRDSESGVEKMAVGRYVDDKGHVITKSRDTRTGDLEENQDYLNIDEAEAPQFNDEFRRRARHYTTPHHQHHSHHNNRASIGNPRQHHRHRAITDGHSRSPYARNSPPATQTETSSPSR